MTEKNTLKNRYEIVFIYDSKFANPNGDPMENNELRIYQDKLFVTDTRLKRTIRDYLDDTWKEIFVKEEIDTKWKTIDVEWKLKNTVWVWQKNITPEHIKQLIEKFIDIRLFWFAIKLKLTWPVQFNFGESMHKIQQMKIQWTSVFASWENKSQWTFTEMFVCPYSVVAFHWVVNEKNASKTGMTEEDYKLLLEWLWNWTKNLITRSKFEQLPRVLVEVKFKEWVKTHIGELDKYIKLEKKEDILNEASISDIEDVVFNFEPLVNKINEEKDKIETVNVYLEHRVKTKWLEGNDLIKVQTINSF